MFGSLFLLIIQLSVISLWSSGAWAGSIHFPGCCQSAHRVLFRTRIKQLRLTFDRRRHESSAPCDKSLTAQQMLTSEIFTDVIFSGMFSFHMLPYPTLHFLCCCCWLYWTCRDPVTCLYWFFSCLMCSRAGYQAWAPFVVHWSIRNGLNLIICCFLL